MTAGSPGQRIGARHGGSRRQVLHRHGFERQDVVTPLVAGHNPDFHIRHILILPHTASGEKERFTVSHPRVGLFGLRLVFPANGPGQTALSIEEGGKSGHPFGKVRDPEPAFGCFGQMGRVFADLSPDRQRNAGTENRPLIPISLIGDRVPVRGGIDGSKDYRLAQRIPAATNLHREVPIGVL